MITENIISQREALNWINSEDVNFVDGSWYLPAQKRNAKEEFNFARIPGAVFFDIDAIADPDTDLPHMLPHHEVFAEVAGLLGLTHDKLIIVYDGPGLFSAPRVWWTLKTMGAQNVKILESGFDTWRQEGMPVEKGKPKQPRRTIFQTRFDSQKVASLSDVERNIENGNAIVLDARPSDRFKGIAPEPREGLRSGHIPNSVSLPSSDLIKNGKLLETNELEQIFDTLNITEETNIITSCGSGVTAAILALALNETGRKNIRLYDGSWAEWGKPNGPRVNTNDK